MGFLLWVMVLGWIVLTMLYSLTGVFGIAILMLALVLALILDGY
jgi:hypothetical protein